MTFLPDIPVGVLAIVGLALTSPNRAPVARITGPATVRVGRTIVLDARTSSDPNRLDSLSYAWDLDGDGRFDDATGPTAMVCLAPSSVVAST